MSPFTNMSKKLPFSMRLMARPQRPPTAKRRFLPWLDQMENRTLLSTLTVMNNHDSGAGSLRADIAAATSGDTIAFADGLRGQTITLTTGELDITTSLNIDGPGAEPAIRQWRRQWPCLRHQPKRNRDHRVLDDHRRQNGRRQRGRHPCMEAASVEGSDRSP